MRVIVINVHLKIRVINGTERITHCLAVVLLRDSRVSGTVGNIGRRRLERHMLFIAILVNLLLRRITAEPVKQGTLMGLAWSKRHDRIDKYLEINVIMPRLPDVSCEMSSCRIADKTYLLISSPQSLVLPSQVKRSIGILKRTVTEQTLVRKSEVVHDKGNVRAAEILDYAGNTSGMMHRIAAARIENHALAVLLVGKIHLQIALL